MTNVHSLKQAGDYLAQLVLNDETVQRACKKVANERSGTGYWSPDDFERNEDTPQYDLYWSEYTIAQSKIVALALNKVLGYEPD